MYKMVNIYKITDINGLCYVGSTTQTIKRRLANHRYHKNNKCKSKRPCSSCQLDLDNCEIEVLETCKPEIRYEREKYYIQNTDCVNIIKMLGKDRDANGIAKEWYRLNKDRTKKRYDYKCNTP